MTPHQAHAGSAAHKKGALGNYFCVFNPMELKLCNIRDIASPNNACFLLLDFHGFWRGNDVISLVPTSDVSDVSGIVSGIGIVRTLRSSGNQNDVIGSATESESEGSEGFLFLPIPLLLPSLTIRFRRFDFH